MQCPKCGEGFGEGAVICPRCDFILDTTFLGDDILNVSTGAHAPVRVSSAGDAVVIGGLDEDVELFSESTGSFLTADTVDVDREVVPAALYVGKSVQELMKAEAVLKPAADVDKRKAMLSAFELHVLSFIDGQRPVARLRKKTGLSGDDVRIAVGMLAEKGAVELVGAVAPPHLRDLLSDEDDEPPDPDATVEDQQVPAAAAQGKSVERQPGYELDPMPALEDASSGATSPWDHKPAPPSATAPDHDFNLTKERAAGFFELAHAELKKGNRVRAHVYAKLAADTDPAEPRYKELLRTWPQAAKAAASTDTALFAEADMAEKQGNFHKALLLLEQAIAANPDAAHIHNRRGLMLATRFKRFSDASDALVRAVELEPNNVAYKNNLGKIIALAEDRGATVTRARKGEGGFLGKLKKAFE